MKTKENSCFQKVDYIVQKLEDKRILSFVLFCFVSLWDEERQAEFTLKTLLTTVWLVDFQVFTGKKTLRKKSNHFMGRSHKGE